MPFMVKVLKPVLNWVCYIATLVGFICLFIKDHSAVIVAVSAFCLLLFIQLSGVPCSCPCDFLERLDLKRFFNCF